MTNKAFTIAPPTTDINGNPLDQSLITGYNIWRLRADGTKLASLFNNIQTLVVAADIDDSVESYYAAEARTDDSVSPLGPFLVIPAAPQPIIPAGPGLSVI